MYQVVVYLVWWWLTTPSQLASPLFITIHTTRTRLRSLPRSNGGFRKKTRPHAKTSYYV